MQDNYAKLNNKYANPLKRFKTTELEMVDRKQPLMYCAAGTELRDAWPREATRLKPRTDLGFPLPTQVFPQPAPLREEKGIMSGSCSPLACIE